MALTMADVESGAFVEQYWREGYAVIRNVFTEDEAAEIRGQFEMWYKKNLEHPKTWVHGNQRVWIENYEEGRVCRGMQWPSYTDPVLDKYRTDRRILQIIEPLIGNDVKQIINQMHWKKPGFPITWRVHQDVRSRKPDEAFRDLIHTYVQLGIAVDVHNESTGGMKILPRSHTQGDLKLEEVAASQDIGGYDVTDGASILNEAGLSIDDMRTVELGPGDVALWTPFTVHGGGINTTESEERRFYINGYAKACNCDRGHLVFKDGEPQLLGEPVLIQIEDFARKEPYYTSEEKLCRIRD